ncbi:nitronate monooxygenase [Microbispora sp. ATCC PTA-5024]|uniref:nitronate monooxygenase n=1 Tax=Microbispora sp. ATCC PTA-5024 TaxID=316330 RepID=UPI0003DC6479|nr:nitronate monooxygenase [Microbispora sp. ATCC PTA-5024]ETK35475.1 2-nitropropane dioxygenase [Microbispora sp. ATCC PTA-5024]
MSVAPLGVEHPIIQAPMAGGGSTPALAAAVSSAGGLGFLAAGYRTAADVRDEIAAVRERTDRPFGVSVFVPGPETADDAAVALYRKELSGEAERYGLTLPESPAWDDDAWDAKVELLVAERVPVAGFTFGCPPPEVAARLREVGSVVLVMVNTPWEAEAAAEAGADVICVQGPGAGGHQTAFLPPPPSWAPPAALTDLVAQVRRVVDVPLVAAGGLMDGADIAAVLDAGAVAGQLGTAFLRTPESGAHPVHKAALADPHFTGTAFTTAFSGRTARGLANRFMAEHEAGAPRCYPQVHHLTKGLRRAAAAQGDPEAMALWAGDGYRRGRELPAARLVEVLVEEIAAARR